MATTKKTKLEFDKTTLITGIVAITSIIVISLLAEATINANATVEKDPCRLISCEGRLKKSAQNVGTDPFTGNVRCKCPNDPEPFYEVAKWKPYTY